MKDSIVFRVLLPTELAALRATGGFNGAPGDRVAGFIHMSTAEQLERTVFKHFRSTDELCVAAVRTSALGGRVKWEPSGEGELYPHLYGPLTLDAVVAAGPLEREPDGRVRVPIAETITTSKS